MEARSLRYLGVVSLIFCCAGANYRTVNFVVDAPSAELAKEIGDAAEYYRKELAVEWLGKAMPNWSRPCPISAKVDSRLGAGGATTFVFEHGEVFGWNMEIQGTRERVLDSVLPHEVTHTIFASHYRRPLPRWADEGACTTVEHDSEKLKQHKLLITFLQTNKGISFNQLFAMKDYPKDPLPLYAQGFSLTRFLIEQTGRREFVAFVGEGMKSENWSATVRKHFGYADLSELQTEWLSWVKQGSPQLASRRTTPNNPEIQLASGTNSRNSNSQVRGQSGDTPLVSVPAESPRQAMPAQSQGGPLLGTREGLLGAQPRSDVGYMPGALRQGDLPAAETATAQPSRYFRNGTNPGDTQFTRKPQTVFEWSRSDIRE